MRKTVLMSMVLAALLTGGFFTSCSDSKDEVKVPEYTWSKDGGITACDNLLFENNVIGNGDDEFVFKGKQTIKKGTYTLKGWIYIADGSELTIEPGTVIKGDKDTKAAIIVERGGKLYAQGSANEPIVFTSAQAKGSRRPGDWGGIILCGKAKNNQDEMQIEGGPRTKHGGSNDSDNSGVLSYVRIEFAGYPFAKDQEINGLTLGSVGNGTKIDHVQVSYSNDDSFEWFGGTVNCKYLVAYKGWDDEFDTDNGFSGKVQYCLSVRDPKIADQSRSNGFESDNCADGAEVSPYTTASFSNVTFIGPIGQTKDFANTADYINGGNMFPNNGSGTGLFQFAMQIRRSSHLQCSNILAVGYPIGFMLDAEKGNTQKYATDGKLKLNNIWIAGCTLLGCDNNKGTEDKLYDYVNKKYDESKESFSSSFFKSQTGNAVKTVDELMLTGASSKIGVNYMPLANSPLLTNGVKVDGMEEAKYIGAFKANDTWMDGWTNFDPENTDY